MFRYGLVTATQTLASWGLIRNSTDFAGVTQLYLSFARVIANFWEVQTTSTSLGVAVRQWSGPFIGIANLTGGLSYDLELF